MPSWSDVLDTEINVAVHVLSWLTWVPLCAFRVSDAAALQVFEFLIAQPVFAVELCWVRVLERRQGDCLRFLAQHCRNARRVCVRETAHFDERSLLRLVCGMHGLETLEVEPSPFGGSFPNPQGLLARLAKYCPRLQHLTVTFRHVRAADRHVLSIQSLAWFGRRLKTLDLGIVAVRIPGGSKTLAACCPQLERLCAQLSQMQEEQHLDAIDPLDLARGCPELGDLDLAPVDWGDDVLRRFVEGAPKLTSLSIRQVSLHASPKFLEPLVLKDLSWEAQACASRLVSLHLALHARTDVDRATGWLSCVAHLRGLRRLSLDYAAPIRLATIVDVALAGTASGAAYSASSKRRDEDRELGLRALAVHGCHGVDDEAIRALVETCPRLDQLRIFPDSWRDLGKVTDASLSEIRRKLPRLVVLALGSQNSDLLSLDEASSSPLFVVSPPACRPPPDPPPHVQESKLGGENAMPPFTPSLARRRAYRQPGEEAPLPTAAQGGERSGRPLGFWRSLSLFAPLGDRSCAGLSRMVCLRHLWLGPHKLMQQGVGVSSSITDVGVAMVARGCPKLLDLTVASLQVTDAGAAVVIRTCRDLRRLRLAGRGITDATLAELRSVTQPRLERFTLWFSGVSTAGARQGEFDMPWTLFDVEVVEPL